MGQLATVGGRVQDAYVVVDAFGGAATQGFLGVYDGHGGIQTASYVATCLHTMLLERMQQEDPSTGTARPVADLFRECYNEIDQHLSRVRPARPSSGRPRARGAGVRAV